MNGIFDAVGLLHAANKSIDHTIIDKKRPNILSKLNKVIDKTTLIKPEIVLGVTENNFEQVALNVFQFQYANCEIYRAYCDAMRKKPETIKSLEKIPFLPISFYKSHTVISTIESIKTPSNEINYDLLFESSGTTGESTSRHYVLDARVYEQSLSQGFEQFYGNPSEYAILALLPSYLERANASLVHMARVLMGKSQHPANGFYINEWEALYKTIDKLENEGQKVLLLGVTFALLDFAASYPTHLKHTVVMETGGMKGRRKEMTRMEVHDELKSAWHLDNIHSEYGMTELLSQAYAKADGLFHCTNTMKVLVRDINDPLEVNKTGNGCLNIIDLANLYSCPFIATEDLGNIYTDSSFEVLGRIDHSILRGCSMMAV